MLFADAIPLDVPTLRFCEAQQFKAAEYILSQGFFLAQETPNAASDAFRINMSSSLITAQLFYNSRRTGLGYTLTLLRKLLKTNALT